ncbi:Flp family type IVb pilin [Arthrobacter sp. Cr_A7]|uniref:Flp family type IVb pilin n=1 Tax=Arthrobacter sp. Cr_A7 TaxID=3031017 RepID=UPI0023DC57A0|nr:Flp family type IVb pilin [Arthrobacter sp. Cr_A7]MDF2052507.1 Flp family type IVb pilin [Arthrobacter sp. Cr_A7]
MPSIGWNEERGATATEYPVLVGFIAIIILTGVGLFGLALDGYYNQLSVTVRAALGLP